MDWRLLAAGLFVEGMALITPVVVPASSEAEFTTLSLTVGAQVLFGLACIILGLLTGNAMRQRVATALALASFILLFISLAVNPDLAYRDALTACGGLPATEHQGLNRCDTVQGLFFMTWFYLASSAASGFVLLGSIMYLRTR